MGDTAVGVSITVSGILSPDFGCSCEHHTVCGENIYLDMLVRFKSVIVEGGKCFLVVTSFLITVLDIFSNHSFMSNPSISTGPRGHTSICGIYWVTEGTDRCLVGRVSNEFKPFFQRLEGRIAQVVDIFPCSDERKKREYSKKRNGVCHVVMLVDRLVEGNIMAMMEVLDLVDEPSSDDDNNDNNNEDDSVIKTTGRKKQKKT